MVRYAEEGQEEMIERVDRFFHQLVIDHPKLEPIVFGRFSPARWLCDWYDNSLRHLR